MTRKTFEDYFEKYECKVGRAIFGAKRIEFDLSRHLQRERQGGLNDTLIPWPSSWRPSDKLGGTSALRLCQQHPLGRLVGVRGRNGELIRVNNPFFTGNKTESHNAPCSGGTFITPCLAARTIRNIQWNMRPGTSISDITKHPDITFIDRKSLSADELTSTILKLAGLADAETATTMSSITYANWANLPEWIEKVLDDSWRVTYGSVGVGEGSAHSVWDLKRQGADTPQLTIRVFVESQTNADGVLDIAASKQAARRRLARIIDSTDYFIELVWMRGNLSAFGDDSVRYADGGGGVIVIAGQTVIEICDEGDTKLPWESFERYVHALLEHTIRRNSPPRAPTMPTIKRGPLVSLASDNPNSCPRKITIRPVDSRFSLWFELDRPVAAADAIVIVKESTSDPAVSHENCEVEGGVRVRFMFVIAKVGHHVVEVHAHFADSETMMSRTQIFEVDVAYTEKQTDYNREDIFMAASKEAAEGRHEQYHVPYQDPPNSWRASFLKLFCPFEWDKPIAAAEATGFLESYVVEEGVRDKFTFAVGRLGHHIRIEVHVVFADPETMVSASTST
ncbi:hypothetical protein EV421DRAFT_1747062 [Armillaria borealis]|uniref:Uncharacterized protein n=1 Tax=Armillaria borealis TaxID=47425 RepID=A0AA39IBZ1_9AGAR|nr:hypothetical protein EV421DRAFT_1747062 [Armillaria borealis]